MKSLLQDLKYGLRMLAKSPGFTAVAVLTLALGIGANTAIFSVVNALLLSPLPYKDSGNLVVLWENDLQRSNPHNTVAPPDYLDWQRQNTVFSEASAIVDERDNLTGSGEPEQVVVQLVSANFFSLLEVDPIIGPGFTPENGQTGKDNVVVLSYGFWKERFGGDPGIIGKTILLNTHAQTVVGVAPRNFDWYIKQGSLTGERAQMWAPFVFPQTFSDRSKIGRFLTVAARLKPTVSPAQAQAQMDTIASRLAKEYPDFNGHWGATVVPLREQLSGDLRPALLILFGAVGFVLLIACANVSSLLLARAAAREREFAIRTAMGASRWRIARQLLTESVFLSGFGGVLGVTLAAWGTNALLAASPKNLFDLREVSLDPRVLTFAAGATLLTGLLFGFLPSYISAHSRISETLKESGRGTSSGKRKRVVRSAFVLSQMALALVLLAGSGLLIRSFVRLIGVDPGFEAYHLLTFQLHLPGAKYGTDQAAMEFFRQLLDRIRPLPGVRSVSMENFPPLTGLGAATDLRILSQPVQPRANLPVANVRVVGPDYFRTMGIPLHAGRTFNDQEEAEARHVVVVNQAFVDQYLRGANPLGQKTVIYMKGDAASEKSPSTIIGVVGDVRQMGLDSPAQPTAYWPYPELVYSGMTIIARTANDPLSLVSASRGAVKQLDSDLPISSVATMDQLLSNSLARARFTMLLLGIFAALALVLAAVGIYGVIAYSVSQRTQEFGIRMALGAQQGEVLRLVLSQGAKLTFAGIAIGVVAALALTRLMSSLLFGVSASDPLTFVGVALVLALVALAACYVPARRATRTDPMVALRYE
ncbi:MAG TPA: ABC transporter permease [Candidatus Acidoferrum sp.]|nr:ABC transporter permease [Candidatus Acidoferrum sp.]